jgi:hypothetical protein
VEADLQRFYGLRLSELGRSLSYRRLLVLVRQLPAESATMRAKAGVSGEWAFTEHLLAGIHDRLSMLVWMQSDRKKSRKPKPLPRPGERSRARSGLSPSEMYRRLRAQQRRVKGGG